jgi:hypothetical protein
VSGADDPLARLGAAGFDLAARSHAAAILRADFAGPLDELAGALLRVRIPVAEIVQGGGGEAPSTQRLRRALAEAGWPKHTFVIRKTVDGVEREQTTHEIDHVRRSPAGALALEIEWNNKDPFFDRDLETFQRLHAEGAISLGLIVTRGASMQARMLDVVRRHAEAQGVRGWAEVAALGLSPTGRQRADVERRVAAGARFADAWARAFVADKFGAATTHWAKLEERVRRGVGNPCPLLLLGLPAAAIDDSGLPVFDDGPTLFERGRGG